ncbi:MAG: hypothetical protein KF691_02485 [Phycisphaeraceae bacterium]|nr:hypothetical protein [Phycisphaeraceae bacterium]
MASWADLAVEARDASFALKEGNRLRAAANRAYYAAFSALTATAIRSGVTMPLDQEGPSHAKAIDGTIVASLHKVKPEDQGRLFSIMPNLYRLRTIADYRPSMLLDDSDIRLALGDMMKAFEILKEEE